jgi:hypothetical protein
MIGYATLGTNDTWSRTTFYETLLATAGGKRLMQAARRSQVITFYGADGQADAGDRQTL